MSHELSGFLTAQAPFFLVALFGLYSVIALLYGVVTFRTVPEEAEALKQVVHFTCI